MGQRICIVLTLLLATALAACDKPGEVKQSPRPDGIVSLSPAATDLLIQLGLLDRIVGVSAYEADPKLKSLLPVVGDYERIDWERVAQLKPKHLVVQGKPDRLPSGLKERCDALGVKLINIQIDRLDDIPIALARLGAEIGIEQTGSDVARRMQIELDAQTVTGQTPALLLLNENGKFTAGRQTFLDDILTRAGGANVITAAGYPTIDQELLLTLKPEVIFILLPSASDAVAAEARASIEKAATLPAVKNKRIVIIGRGDVLLPSASNAKVLLKEFVEGLSASERRVSVPSPRNPEEFARVSSVWATSTLPARAVNGIAPGDAGVAPTETCDVRAYSCRAEGGGESPAALTLTPTLPHGYIREGVARSEAFAVR